MSFLHSQRVFTQWVVTCQREWVFYVWGKASVFSIWLPDKGGSQEPPAIDPVLGKPWSPQGLTLAMLSQVLTLTHA